MEGKRYMIERNKVRDEKEEKGPKKSHSVDYKMIVLQKYKKQIIMSRNRKSEH